MKAFVPYLWHFFIYWVTSIDNAELHQDILHRGLDKRQYSIYTEKGKRATDQPLLPQSHFSAVDCFYRVFFAEPNKNCVNVKK